MPRINTLDGRSVMGIGSGTVSVDGVTPASLVGVAAGGTRWLDESGSVIVYQNVTAGSVLQTLDLDGGSPTTVSSAGQNEMGAGGGVWAAFLSTGANVGLRTNISGFTRLPLAGPADVDEDGLFACVQNFQAGMGMIAFSASGVEAAKWDVKLAGGYVIRCRTGLCAFPATGFVWQVRRLSDGTPITMSQRTETINYMVPLELASGHVLLLERSERLTLRDATQSQGWVLTEDDTFTPDCIELSPGVIRIAYSATAGEGPTALRVIDFTLSTGATSLGTSAGGSLVFTAGPTLTAATLPAAGGSELGLGAYRVSEVPWVYPKTGLLTTTFGSPFLRKLVAMLGQPIDLASQVTGVLPQEHGGTGEGSGLTIIDASNVTIGTLPQNVKWTQFDTDATGTQNNLAFDSGTTQADYIRAGNASALTITGLEAGVPGQRLVIIATSASVLLVHQSGSSTAENRILTSDGSNVTLLANQGALLEYDGTDDRWRVLAAAGGGSTTVGSAAPIPGIPGDDGLMGPPGPAGRDGTPQDVESAGYWSPLTDGDLVAPELIFALGDTISVWTPTP